jgi:hypothetical protein
MMNRGGTLMKYALMFATAAAWSVAAFAQAPAQNPSTATATAPSQAPVTIVGCIEKESDYRAARDQGRGGVAGTGVGAGNEFVLTNASMANSTGAVGTSGSTGSASSMTMSYELSGSGEGQAAAFVGKRVEVMGRLKAEEIGAAGPTGGPTAGAPPSGVDVASKDLKLREFEVTSIKASSSGSCPASTAPVR